MSVLRHSLPLVEGSPAPGAPACASGTADHSDRFLLSRDNQKLGERIASFSLPAGGKCCPGRSRGCSAVIKTGPRSKGSRRCYVLGMYRRHPSVLVNHQRNLETTRDLKAFVRRVIREIRFRQIEAVRWHVAGDVFSVGYARALRFIMTALPEVEFLLYSRSWRVPRLRVWLERMACLPNCAVWWSVDRYTGLPEGVPDGIRLAWMALHVSEGEPWACGDQIADCQLVFMDQGLRPLRLATFGGTMVCPAENDEEMTCSRCRFCLPARGAD